MYPLVHALPRWSAGKVVWHFYLLSSEHYNWQPGTRIDLTTAAQPTIRGEIQLARICRVAMQGKSRVARPHCETRASYPGLCPGLLDLCFSFTEAYLSGFFLCVSTASDQWWSKNVQGKSLGDTLLNHSTPLCI